MNLWMALGALALVVVLALLWLRQRSGRSDNSAEDRLDTVAAWPPSATRVLTSAERDAYALLLRAMPGHMVLAQVPLARFLKVPTRHSYSEWLRRLGSLCADFVVCDMASEVLAVVSVRAPAGQESERSRKRQLRMARVLKAAGIPLHVWTRGSLPSVEVAREVLLSSQAAAPAAAPVLPAGAPAPAVPARAAVPVAAPAASPFDDGDRDSTQDERIELRDPTPSTWFDEFNSGPAPLPEERRRDRSPR